MTVLFVKDNPYPGASSKLRRTLSMAHLECAAVQKLQAACKLLNLNLKVPVYRTGEHECWAHAGLPHLRLAFFVTTSNDLDRTEAARSAWAKNGWRLWGLPQRSVERVSVEALAENLKRELKQIGKMR